MSLDVFLPSQDGVGTSITVDVASARAVVQAGAGQQVRLMNSGTNVIFVKFGNVTVVATSSNLAMLPNSVEMFTIPGNINGDLNVAAISGASGNTLYISPGVGV